MMMMLVVVVGGDDVGDDDGDVDDVDDYDFHGDYVNVAFKRNLSLIQCRKLTGRLPKTEKITETKLEKSSVKDRLIELKSMLDDGLISQELYDKKSAKLLEDF